MSRNEMIHNLRKFRDAWEKNMGRNQDLSDERLAEETDKSLRNHLEYYYSETAKNQAANWIRDDS
jgi:t-SNARE complex subunit (syntaxin)